MLNTVLAWIAALVWTTAYGLFFMTDLRRWWRGRAQRQAAAAAERERARRAYADWVRDIPPPPSRLPQMPPPPAPRPAAPQPPGAVVIPFPRRRAGGRR